MEAKSIVKQPTAGAPDAAQLRAHLHGMWAAVAASWGEHAAYVDARGAGVTAELLRRSAPREGERVLELACGPGGVGLAAAPLVAPGEVVLSDVAGEMTAIAAARAASSGSTTSARATSIWRTSTSPTPPTTSCSAARA